MRQDDAQDGREEGEERGKCVLGVQRISRLQRDEGYGTGRMTEERSCGPGGDLGLGN